MKRATQQTRNQQFDVEYLKQITHEENSCVEVIKTNLHLTIHPSQLKDFTLSLKEIISRQITRYNKELKGILLGYDNIVLLSSDGFINYDNCFMHINVEGDFYIFKPEIGRLLKGIVNKKSKSHLGCLVYRLFNASIPCPEDDEEWLGDSVSVNQEILFKIVETNLNRKLPYIKGEIVSVLSDSDSGISTGEENANKITKFDYSDEEPTEKKKKHKRKTVHSESEDYSPKKKKRKTATVDAADFEIESEVTDSPMKKSKKKKSKHANEVQVSKIEPEVLLENEDTHSKKKKKKSRYSEDTQDYLLETETSSEKKKKKSGNVEDTQNYLMKQETEAQNVKSRSEEKKKRKKKNSEIAQHSLAESDVETYIEETPIKTKKKKSKIDRSLEIPISNIKHLVKKKKRTSL